MLADVHCLRAGSRLSGRRYMSARSGCKGLAYPTVCPTRSAHSHESAAVGMLWMIISRLHPAVSLWCLPSSIQIMNDFLPAASWPLHSTMLHFEAVQAASQTVYCLQELHVPADSGATSPAALGAQPDTDTFSRVQGEHPSVAASKADTASGAQHASGEITILSHPYTHKA